MKINNPLRYPGAKSKLASYIQKLIITEELEGCTFYEPYAGSAAVTFQLLENNIVAKAKLNELDPLIYSFWYSVMHHTDELIAFIENVDISIASWNNFSKYKDSEFIHDKTVIEVGFAGLFLNRTNYSGILKANPLGGINQTSEYTIDCRFNKQRIIESIRALSTFSNRIELFNMDAIEFIQKETKYKRHDSIFVYIDPPYYEKGPSLYRYYYDDIMHKSLAQFILPKAFPWLISYDDTYAIKKMYKRRNLQPIYLDYSVNTCRKGMELLISNLEIPPLEQKAIKEKTG